MFWTKMSLCQRSAKAWNDSVLIFLRRNFNPAHTKTCLKFDWDHFKNFKAIHSRSCVVYVVRHPCLTDYLASAKSWPEFFTSFHSCWKLVFCAVHCHNYCSFFVCNSWHNIVSKHNPSSIRSTNNNAKTNYVSYSRLVFHSSMLALFPLLFRPAPEQFPGQLVHIIDQARGKDGWILTKFSFCFVMDQDEVEARKNARRERGQYPAILTELAWSITDLLYRMKSTEKMIFVHLYFRALKRKPVRC